MKFRAAVHLQLGLRCLGITLVVATWMVDSLSAEDAWTGFQNGGRVVVPGADAPLRWSATEGLAWQSKLAGYGQSSPVVFGDNVYVTSTSGEMKDQLHIEAWDLHSGQRRWQHTTRNSSPEKSSEYVSRAAPTPVCDPSGVIALFEGGNVVALSPEGKIRWQRDLVADYGPITARHGLGSSLEQNETRVFAWLERQEQPYLIALSKETGETLWKADGLGATSWSTPRLITTADGSQHLVCSASGKVAGFDPQTGQRLWELTEISNNTTCTPTPLDKGTFLIGASDGRGEQTSGSGAASNGLVRITAQADGTYQAEFVWRAKKASSSFGSPIAVDNKALIVNRTGVLYQLDATTGDELSATRTSSGGIWATPLVLGDYLYLFGYKGTTAVLSLHDGSEVAQNRLWPEQPSAEGEMRSGPVLYAAAAANPYLLLRSGDTLFAVQSTAQATAAPVTPQSLRAAALTYRANRTNRFSWTRVGGFYLPDRSFTVEVGADGARVVHEITFSDHQLTAAAE